MFELGLAEMMDIVLLYDLVFCRFGSNPGGRQVVGFLLAGLAVFTLSGPLNFMDGLWYSCGDEKIIVFTTNYKDRIDPALLRPGRMDMHILMSYCTTQGFKLLAPNYLDIRGHHKLFGEIEGLIDIVKATPAEVAEELIRSENPDVALGGVVNLFKRKQIEPSNIEEPEVQQAKRLRIDFVKKKRAVRNWRKNV
ncbi:hypothetical protein F0562_006371 [Nyssa sinensis]|uniref:Uncharacterized protein n=1 Tax=Nyssa sinensis TaxID=561372 RepID=A0A5J5AQ78_9ASTE|nr:hypothetical protein F0562_006371 [Nyssa sinensis]